MLNTPFESLLFEKQHRRIPADKIPNTMGYDTETVKGLCMLLADENTAIQPKCFNDIASFLTRKKYQGYLGFFYNMRYDFQAILKWLPVSNWSELMEKGGTSTGRWDITYIPKKMFSIRRNIDRRRVNNKKKGKKTGARGYTFFDISQFYGKMKLAKAAEKYLTTFNVKGKMDISSFGFDIKHLKETDMHHPVIIDYCIHDAHLCGMLARHWIKICNKMGLYPTNFCSPASIASRYFLSKTRIPHINRLRKTPEFLYYPWLACSGAFISVFKRGYFEKVYEYDLNSAYPFYMSQLPDLDYGTLYILKGKPPSDAVLGWLRVQIEIPFECYCPPIPIQRKTLCNYFPFGIFEAVITLDEYNYYRQEFNVKPIQGCYWIPDMGFEMVYPFKDIVDELYLIKAQNKKGDKNIYEFSKTGLNGFYGKFLERHLVRDKDDKQFGKNKTGNFFFPFYGSYILAGTRLCMYDATKKIDKKFLIGCSTDALFSTSPINLPMGKKLGQWDIANQGEMLMMGCGVYAIKTKEKTKQKTRGFRTITLKKDQKNLFDYVKEYHKSDKVTLPITVNLTMGNMLRQKTPEKMNLIIDDTKDISINFDTKRLWVENFKNAGELLEKNVDSYPLPYGIIGH